VLGVLAWWQYHTCQTVNSKGDIAFSSVRSVCLSVCLSVCPDACQLNAITPESLEISSRNFQGIILRSKGSITNNEVRTNKLAWSQYDLAEALSNRWRTVADPGFGKGRPVRPYLDQPVVECLLRVRALHGDGSIWLWTCFGVDSVDNNVASRIICGGYLLLRCRPHILSVRRRTMVVATIPSIDLCFVSSLPIRSARASLRGLLNPTSTHQSILAPHRRSYFRGDAFRVSRT